MLGEGEEEEEEEGEEEEEEAVAAGPDQLSLVSKLNGYRTQWYEIQVLAPGFNLKWQKYKFFWTHFVLQFSSLSISQFSSDCSWWLWARGEAGLEACTGRVLQVLQWPISPHADASPKSAFPVPRS